MVRVRLLAFAAVTALVSACAPMLGPPPPGYAPPMPGEPVFRASEFAWSQVSGPNAIVGHIAYAQGQTRYTCQGASVILTPETPWSRRRMEVLYLSAERAALPAEEVRARQANAPPGDSSPFIRRATCDAADHFSFAGLPAGPWYVITIAKPAHGGGPSVALMKRVVTRGGKAANVAL